MQRIIKLAFLIPVLFLFGCNEETVAVNNRVIPSEKCRVQISDLDKDAADYIVYRTITIENCEYLVWNSGAFLPDHRSRAINITHKGNCKFCTERRFQERFTTITAELPQMEQDKQIRESAIAKLSDDERRVLGIKEGATK